MISITEYRLRQEKKRLKRLQKRKQELEQVLSKLSQTNEDLKAEQAKFLGILNETQELLHVTKTGHLPTCTQFCAVRHCWCGSAALHGMKVCGNHNSS